MKLIDELGTEETAVAWLESDRHVGHALPIRDYKPRSRTGVFGFFSSAAAAADALGFSETARVASALGAVADRPRLDGLMAVWQVTQASEGIPGRPAGTPHESAGVGAQVIKSELVQRIAEKNPHLYQRDIEKVVNAVLDGITSALERGDRVELRGFGAFSVKRRDARLGRNPRTATTSPSWKRLCRSSRPARRCASGSTPPTKARPRRRNRSSSRRRNA